MNIIAIAGLALLAAAFNVMLRRYNQEYALMLGIAVGIVILTVLLSSAVPVLKQLQDLLEATGMSGQYITILCKALGICFMAQFVADACKDAGESALASKVEFAGKFCIMILALPLFQQILQVALQLIHGS